MTAPATCGGLQSKEERTGREGGGAVALTPAAGVVTQPCTRLTHAGPVRRRASRHRRHSTGEWGDTVMGPGFEEQIGGNRGAGTCNLRAETRLSIRRSRDLDPFGARRAPGRTLYVPKGLAPAWRCRRPRPDRRPARLPDYRVGPMSEIAVGLSDRGSDFVRTILDVSAGHLRARNNCSRVTFGARA